MRKIKYKEPEKSFVEKVIKAESSRTRISVGMEGFGGEYYFLSMEKITPYKNQARSFFDEGELDNLALSIKEHGVRQPLTVMKSAQEGMFEVVSGERRFRAAKQAGLKKVPCIVLEAGAHDEEIAIVENIHRADLHPLELAKGLKILLDKHGWGGQTELSERLSIPRTKISETVNLLEIPDRVQELLIQKNCRGRDILRKVSSLETEKEQLDFVNNLVIKVKLKASSSSPNKEKTISLLRMSLQGGDIKIQKKNILKLQKDELVTVISSLKEILKEAQERINLF